MTIPSVDTSAAITWLTVHAIPLLVAAVALFLIYRWARPRLHGLLVRIVHGRAGATETDPALLAETDRRVETLEDLFAKVLRFGVAIAVIIVVLGVFDLWPVLAGLGLVLAALTLAGQDIILDYLMGILILIEGQYFKGDVVQLGAVEGTVEEVGIRRTVVRDVRGTVHSVSNGTIRVSSNRTRTYAMATVDLDGIADRDVEAVIELFDEVGKELAADPRFSPKLLDTPGYAATIRLSSTGATLRLGGRVQPEARVEIEAELRRRVAAGMAAREIQPIRPGAYPTGSQP
jgi:moderate conductance mechanosensitive channel